MKKKFLADYIDKQLKKARKQVGLARNGSDESIHQIRLRFKRIRGFLRFVDYARPGKIKPKKMLSEYHKLYRALGIYRDLGVQIGLVHEYERTIGVPVLLFHTYLAGQQEMAAEKAHRALMKYEPAIKGKYRKKVAKIIGKRSGEHWQRDLLAMFHNRMLLLDSLSSAEEPDYHAIRRDLKELMYLLRLMEKTATPSEIPVDSDHLSVLEQYLGNWHDRDVLKRSMAEYEQQHGMDAPQAISGMMSLTQAIERDQETFIAAYKTGFNEVHSSIQRYEST